MNIFNLMNITENYNRATGFLDTISELKDKLFKITENHILFVSLLDTVHFTATKYKIIHDLV